jgi:uncharacterized protein YbjT (DUF2867 family)
MQIRLIITGVTGMVGEGVLNECLAHPDVEHVLVLSRKTCCITHPKLTEILHDNFYDLSPVREYLRNYNGCLFCLGVTSLGKKEPEYYSLTYTLTMNFAETLAAINPGMTFCYISGAGTDSTEEGRINWARVKGKTENDLMKLPFKKVYNFRPGFLQPAKGAKHVHGFNFIYNLLYPVSRTFFPKYVSTIRELGLAMIYSVTKGYHKQIIEVTDIVDLAKKY